jgi:hypothetical protein
VISVIIPPTVFGPTNDPGEKGELTVASGAGDGAVGVSADAPQPARTTARRHIVTRRRMVFVLYRS